MNRYSRWLVALILPLMLGGCASMVTGNLAGSLSRAIVNQDDPETVRQGAPAYLLLLDGLIADNPDDTDLLLAGARLYGAYAAVFVDDTARAKHMAVKARDYGRRALCLAYADLCAAEKEPFDRFVPQLAEVQASDVDRLYVYAVSWAGWIQSASSDWAAVADLPKVEAALRRVVALDDRHANGQAHLYLGVMNTLLPPALGGKPEQGKAQFEQAIAISGGKDLMAKVEYARRYARLVFDRELHDRLLKEVLAADPHVPGLTLSNVLAQKEAAALLASSHDYFLE